MNNIRNDESEKISNYLELEKQIEVLNSKIAFLQLNNDPSISATRTANIVSLISLVVVIVVAMGGSGLYLQGQNANSTDKRLDNFSEELKDAALGSRNAINDRFSSISNTFDVQLKYFEQRFSMLEESVNRKIDVDNGDRSLSLKSLSPDIFYRGEENDGCTGQFLIEITNNTELLTELVYYKVYSKKPFATANLSGLLDWDAVDADGLADKSWRYVVGVDKRYWYEDIFMDNRFIKDFLSDWSPTKTYPIRFELSYIRTNNITSSVVLNLDLTVSESFLKCARSKLLSAP